MLNKITSSFFSIIFLCILALFPTFLACKEYLNANYKEAHSSDESYIYYLRSALSFKSDASNEEISEMGDIMSKKYDVKNRGFLPIDAYKQGNLNAEQMVVYGANEYAYEYYKIFLRSGNADGQLINGKIPLLLNENLENKYNLGDDVTFTVGNVEYQGIVGGFIEKNVRLPASRFQNFEAYKISLRNQIVVPYSLIFEPKEINTYYLTFTEKSIGMHDIPNNTEKKAFDYLKEQSIVKDVFYFHFDVSDTNMSDINKIMGCLDLCEVELEGFFETLLMVVSILYGLYACISNSILSKKYFVLKNISTFALYFLFMLICSLVIYNTLGSVTTQIFLGKYALMLPILVVIFASQSLIRFAKKRNKVKFIEKELKNEN